ncbi:hypothetical protein HK098_000081 [Nowakowskiella sp. JEL0407]|nr:hypothetical protein HK098_000081 [Nowakowskiella sp. JEL0407]
MDVNPSQPNTLPKPPIIDSTSTESSTPLPLIPNEPTNQTIPTKDTDMEEDIESSDSEISDEEESLVRLEQKVKVPFVEINLEIENLTAKSNIFSFPELVKQKIGVSGGTGSDSESVKIWKKKKVGKGVSDNETGQDTANQSSDDENGEADGEISTQEAPPKKKRKPRDYTGEYDIDDDFIDDSEMMMEEDAAPFFAADWSFGCFIWKGPVENFFEEYENEIYGDKAPTMGKKRAMQKTKKTTKKEAASKAKPKKDKEVVKEKEVVKVSEQDPQIPPPQNPRKQKADLIGSSNEPKKRRKKIDDTGSAPSTEIVQPNVSTATTTNASPETPPKKSQDSTTPSKAKNNKVELSSARKTESFELNSSQEEMSISGDSEDSGTSASALPDLLPPTVISKLDSFKVEVEKATFTPRKFPENLKPILLDLALDAEKLSCLNDIFYEELQKILPYNDFTTRRLVQRSVLIHILSEKKDNVEKWYDQAQEMISRMVKEQELDVSNAAQVIENGGESQGEPGTERKFRWVGELVTLIWNIREAEVQIPSLHERLNAVNNSKYPLPKWSEQSIRNAVHSKLAGFWPEGVMSTGEISRKLSAYKQKQKNIDLKSEKQDVTDSIKSPKSASKPKVEASKLKSHAASSTPVSKNSSVESIPSTNTATVEVESRKVDSSPTKANPRNSDNLRIEDLFKTPSPMAKPPFFTPPGFHPNEFRPGFTFPPQNTMGNEAIRPPYPFPSPFGPPLPYDMHYGPFSNPVNMTPTNRPPLEVYKLFNRMISLAGIVFGEPSNRAFVLKLAPDTTVSELKEEIASRFIPQNSNLSPLDLLIFRVDEPAGLDPSDVRLRSNLSHTYEITKILNATPLLNSLDEVGKIFTVRRPGLAFIVGSASSNKQPVPENAYIQSPQQQTPWQNSSDGNMFKHHVVSEYTPQQPDELRLFRGSDVVVVSILQNGWAQGYVSNMPTVMGRFPLSCTDYNGPSAFNGVLGSVPQPQPISNNSVIPSASQWTDNTYLNSYTQSTYVPPVSMPTTYDPPKKDQPNTYPPPMPVDIVNVPPKSGNRRKLLWISIAVGVVIIAAAVIIGVVVINGQRGGASGSGSGSSGSENTPGGSGSSSSSSSGSSTGSTATPKVVFKMSSVVYGVDMLPGTPPRYFAADNNGFVYEFGGENAAILTNFTGKSTPIRRIKVIGGSTPRLYVANVLGELVEHNLATSARRILTIPKSGIFDAGMESIAYVEGPPQRLFVGDEFGRIFQWNIDTNTATEGTLFGTPVPAGLTDGGVLALYALPPNTLFSAHHDGYVREWTISSGALLRTYKSPYKGKLNAVAALAGEPNRVFGGSDSSLSMIEWTSNGNETSLAKNYSFKTIFTDGDINDITILNGASPKLYLCAFGSSVWEYDLSKTSTTPSREFSGMGGAVQRIAVLPGKLLAGGSGSSAAIFNL